MRAVSVSLGMFIDLALCLASVTGDEPKPANLALRKVEVAFSVPDPSYWCRIAEIRKVGDEIWVRGEVNRFPDEPDRVFPQVISEVKDSFSIRLPDLPLKYIITGKSWEWPNKEKFTFVTDLEGPEGKRLMDRFKSGEVWFSLEVQDR